MGLESLVNSGFPRGTVEMRKARLRALTPISETVSLSPIRCRNEESPIKGIDTLFICSLFHCLKVSRNEESPIKGIDTVCDAFVQPPQVSVEMRKARLRALTRLHKTRTRSGFFRRNEESPIKGIDTETNYFPPFFLGTVEMRKARLRALTHIKHCRYTFSNLR